MRDVVLNPEAICERLENKPWVRVERFAALPRAQRRAMTHAQWFEYGFEAGYREGVKAILGDDLLEELASMKT